MMENLTQKTNSNQESLDYIRGFLSKNNQYSDKTIIGFPGSDPLPISVEAYYEALSFHANNIGVHTNVMECEQGFLGTQAAEVECIETLCQWLEVPPEKIDGYITSGATEANIVALWAARNTFQNSQDIAIISSFVSHYSLNKAANLLGIGNINYVGVNPDLSLNVQALEVLIQRLVKEGKRRIILFSVVGSTSFGSIDDVEGINELLKNTKQKYQNLDIHFHIDAAYGGFLAPFIGKLRFVSELDTISIDGHKTGLMPYGIGFFLGKRGLLESIKTHAPYFPGDDMTLIGSRPGAAAISALATLKHVGYEGYRTITEQMIEQASWIESELREMGLEMYPRTTNVVAVKDPGLKTYKALQDLGYVGHSETNFPTDLDDFSKKDQLTEDFFSIIVMPHFFEGLAEKLVGDIWTVVSEL
jgi:glutamate/tyrosine decarboxylase-like PLP-dependent enzyme